MNFQRKKKFYWNMEGENRQNKNYPLEAGEFEVKVEGRHGAKRGRLSAHLQNGGMIRVDDTNDLEFWMKIQLPQEYIESEYARIIKAREEEAKRFKLIKAIEEEAKRFKLYQDLKKEFESSCDKGRHKLQKKIPTGGEYDKYKYWICDECGVKFHNPPGIERFEIILYFVK